MAGQARSTLPRYRGDSTVMQITLLRIRQEPPNPGFEDPFSFTEEDFNRLADQETKTAWLNLDARDRRLGVALFAVLKRIEIYETVNHYKLMVRLGCMTGTALTELAGLLIRDGEDNIISEHTSSHDQAKEASTLSLAFDFLTSILTDARDTNLDEGVETFVSTQCVWVATMLHRWLSRGFDLIQDEQTYADSIELAGVEFHTARVNYTDVAARYSRMLMEVAERTVEKNDRGWVIAALEGMDLPATICTKLVGEFNRDFVKHGKTRQAWTSKIVTSMQDDNIHCFIASLGEKLYYEATRAPVRVGDGSLWQTLIDTAQRALMMANPVTFMHEQPTGYVVHLTVDEDCALALGLVGRYPYMWRIEIAAGHHLNSALDKWTVLGPHALGRELEAMRTIARDSSAEDIHKILVVHRWDALAVLILFSWATRFLALKASPKYSTTDVEYFHEMDTTAVPYKTIARSLSQLPTESLIDLAKMSGIPYPWDRIDIKKVREAMLSFAPGKPSEFPATECFEVVLCLMGFENLRQQQYSLLMGVYALMAHRPVQFRVRYDAPPGLRRFLRIFGGLSPDYAKSLAREHTGEQYGKPVPWELLAAFRQEDIANFLKGELSQWFIQQSVDPMKR